MIRLRNPTLNGQVDLFYRLVSIPLQCGRPWRRRADMSELGVHEMILLTNSPTILVALAGYGLSIVGQRAIVGDGED